MRVDYYKALIKQINLYLICATRDLIIIINMALDLILIKTYIYILPLK